MLDDNFTGTYGGFKMGTKRVIKRAASNIDTPLSMAFDEFISEKKILGKSKATIDNYELTYRLFVEFFNYDDDNVAVNDITLDHFYKWLHTMNNEGVKTTTINHYIRDIRVFFNWCMAPERAYISVPYKIPTLQGQEEQIKLFSDEDLETLLDKPRKNDSFVDWRTWTICNWVLATGNRAATICEVKLGDIDYYNGTIALRHTKNKKAQVIPLSSSLESVLKEYIRLWRAGCGADDWLFPSVSNEQLSTHALKLSFAKYCKDRGAQNTNIHGLRHNFAKGWIVNGGNMFILQKILGHSTLEMTRKYVRLFDEDLKTGFDDFNPLDNIKRNKSRTQAIKKADDLNFVWSAAAKSKR